MIRVHYKKLFDSRCPYTGEICESWECDACEVEKTERYLFDEEFEEVKDGEND